jgi:hypothetical protein
MPTAVKKHHCSAIMEWNALPGRTAHVNGQTIYFGTAGAGPAVLLLHGHPQTSQYVPTFPTFT